MNELTQHLPRPLDRRFALWTGNVAARNEAIPAVTFVGPPSVWLLSNNCTGPAGVAFPFGFTVTVNVTGVPTPTCRFEEEIVVVVLTGPPLLPPPPHALIVPNTASTNRQPQIKLRPPRSPSFIPSRPNSSRAPAKTAPFSMPYASRRRAVFTPAAGLEASVKFNDVVARPPLTITEDEPNEHVYPAGTMVPPVAHVNSTAPVNPPLGVIVTVVLPRLPVANEIGFTVMLNNADVTCAAAELPFHAAARFPALTDPRPVTRSNPGPATSPCSIPFTPVWLDEHPGDPPVHGSELFPEVMS